MLLLQLQKYAEMFSQTLQIKCVYVLQHFWNAVRYHLTAILYII